MEYFFSEPQKTVRDLARRIAEERILPVRAELDEKEEFPWDIIKDLADSDMFRVFIPEEYEGLSGGGLALCLVIEELSRACSGVAVCYAASALGSYAILDYGTEAQKQKYLPDIASGKRLAAFALTEATAGSDAANIKTTAEKVSGGYRLNGTKQFITNGGDAEIYTVIALTDHTKGSRGASAFLVEKGTPGFDFGKKEKKMGIRANPTCELIFQECRIPAANLIGREGRGFMMAMQTFDTSRPGVGAQALGIAAGALEYATKYARQRVVFGKPIWNHQGLAFKLADMAIKVEAARALIYAVARAIDAGFKRPTKYAAMAKTFASDIAMEVTTEAVQVLGGFGYMREYPVEKMMRDAKITQIYEGTNEIQRDEISRHLVKEAAN